jgi:hypothetical protein
MDGRCPGAYHEGCNHTLHGWTLMTVDPDTVLTGLYVLVDESCQASAPPARWRGRPHALGGFHACCCWLNRQRGRPALAFADLLGG